MRCFRFEKLLGSDQLEGVDRHVGGIQTVSSKGILEELKALIVLAAIVGAHVAEIDTAVAGNDFPAAEVAEGE